MNKKVLQKLLCFLGATVCSLLISSVWVVAVDNDFSIKQPENEPDAFIIETLNIISDQAILEGDVQQMQIEDHGDFVVVNWVEWSSSNPSVIACTKDGKITGIKEGKATITVKAKIGNARDSITVYCAGKLSKSVSSHIAQFLAYTCKTPSFFDLQYVQVYLPPFITTNLLNVKGVYGSYFYVTQEKDGVEVDGFILQNWMPKNVASDEIFRQLSENEIVVFSGESSTKKLTTNFKDDVVWKVSDNSVVSFSSSTGVIIAKKPGTAIITATGGTKTLSCMVFSVSRWHEEEISTTAKEVKVRSVPSSVGKVVATLPKGSPMRAVGDLENGSGWIYIISDDVTGFIQVSDFPGIDYLMAQYHYYDKGFDMRFGSPMENIYDYASVLNDVMLENFNLKVCSYVDEYTSAADQCKIWQYGSVALSNLYAVCPRSGNHHSDSCLSLPTTHETLVDEKGVGTDVVGKCLWTGHVLEPHTSSMTSVNQKTIVFTIANCTKYISSTNTYDNLTKATIERKRLYEIVHETGHLLGVTDGYCFGVPEGQDKCNNRYCYACNDKSIPDCIMIQSFNPDESDSVFCDECKETIKSHLSDHH